MITPQGPLAESGSGVREGRLVGRGVSVAGRAVLVDVGVGELCTVVGIAFCAGMQDARINIIKLVEIRRIYFISGRLSFHTIFLAYNVVIKPNRICICEGSDSEVESEVTGVWSELFI
jgi:hypothetical protein